MERLALSALRQWWGLELGLRKPLVLRGARQVGKSFLVRDFCRRQGLTCLEINFEKEPRLRSLFQEGENSKTVTLLAAHFGRSIDSSTVLFLDEIQAAPEIFGRLRYFYEDTPEVAVIAAGSLLDFVLAEPNFSVPVGRLEYLHLGPMVFEEFLLALGESALLSFLVRWHPFQSETDIPAAIHDKLNGYVREFGIVGGMPEAVASYVKQRDFLRLSQIQENLIEAYRNDFAKYRKRLPQERLDRVFQSIPTQIGKKWVHARVSQHDKAAAIQGALDLLILARVAHRVTHSSGNGVPLASERNDHIFKLIFLDVGLAASLLGLRVTDVLDIGTFSHVFEGALAEQWIGQHLLDLRTFSQAPQIYYWVREKSGSLAEVDYLTTFGPGVIPVEVKSGSLAKAKSLHVFLHEKQKSPCGILFSPRPARWSAQFRVLELPYYLVGQVHRILDFLPQRSIS